MERNYQAKAIEDTFSQFFDVREERKTAQQKRDASIVKGFMDMAPSLQSNPVLWERISSHPDFQTDIVPALRRSGYGYVVSQDAYNPSRWMLNVGQDNQYKTTDALLAAAAQNPNDPILAPAAVRAQRLKAMAPQYDPSLQQDLSYGRQQGTNQARMQDPNFMAGILRDVDKEMKDYDEGPDMISYLQQILQERRLEMEANAVQAGYTPDEMEAYIGALGTEQEAKYRTGKKGRRISETIDWFLGNQEELAKRRDAARSSKIQSRLRALQGG